MRIAFYAPMKAADHPLPSGDRSMARMLVAALEGAGHTVETACRLSSFDAAGDAAQQRRIAGIGRRLGDRLLRRWRARPAAARPRLWFTYHLYHKAPDWLGPRVSAGLGIAYVVAEASHAGKQAHGRWAIGHAAAADAIARADLVLGLNSADTDGVRPLLAGPDRLLSLPPFIDARLFAQARARRPAHRRELCARRGIGAAAPLLLVVAMMRAGDKLASYRLLADALTRLVDRPWRLLIAGDGPARPQVREAFAGLGDRVVWLSRLDADDVAAVYAGADLYVWPAIGEAWGMTLLEAQAAGLPVIAGRTGGVADVVADGETGLLVPVGGAPAFAAAVSRLLDDPRLRSQMGEAAAARVAARHDLPGAGRIIDAAVRRLLPPAEARR